MRTKETRLKELWCGVAALLPDCFTGRCYLCPVLLTTDHVYTCTVRLPPPQSCALPRRRPHSRGRPPQHSCPGWLSAG